MSGYPFKYAKNRKIVLAQTPLCKQCGATENLTVDHIIPVSLGGSSDLFNLQVLCGECNLKKGHQTTMFQILKTYWNKRKLKPFDALNARIKSLHAVALGEIHAIEARTKAELKRQDGQRIADIKSINTDYAEAMRQYKEIQATQDKIIKNQLTIEDEQLKLNSIFTHIERIDDRLTALEPKKKKTVKKIIKKKTK